MNADSWYYSSVEFVCVNGLFTGVSAGAFHPDDNMTRAMLATVLHRLAGEPAGSGASFVDVPEDTWYSSAVLWARGEGIVTGSQSKFGPEDPITREQLIVMMFRYAAITGFPASEDGKDLSGFVDSDTVSHWAKDAMAWAVHTGLVSGKPGNCLDPRSSATRAEVAVILQRLTEILRQAGVELRPKT